MRTAKSRRKSYADVRRRSLEFEIRDPVFLKVTPMKGVLRFRCKGKLSPNFIEPFEILERVGPVAYKLVQPPAHLGVHDVFHVLMLRKYITDPIHEIDYEALQLNEDLSYEEKLVKILGREVKTLCNMNIAFVKVLERNHHSEEAMWESENEIREIYPELVQKFKTFEDESSF